MQQRQKEDDARRQKFLKNQNSQQKKEQRKQRQKSKKSGKLQKNNSESILQSDEEDVKMKDDWKADKLMRNKKIYGDSDSEGSNEEDQIPVGKRRLRSSAQKSKYRKSFDDRYGDEEEES